MSEVMSEPQTSARDRDKKDIEDWMAGQGGKILAVVLIVLVAWLVLSLFWS